MSTPIPTDPADPSQGEHPLACTLPLPGITLQGHEWRPERRGQPGAGPSLMFVHATGFHGRVWDAVIRRLPGRHALALDQRGHGGSQALPFDTWEAFGRDAAAAAAHWRLQGAVGVGHSMGGGALVLAAAMAPGTFSRLVLVDPVLLAPSAYFGPPPAAGTAPPAANRKSRFDSVEAMVARFADRPPYAHFTREALWAYCRHALKPAADGVGLELCCSPAFEASVYAAARHSGLVYAAIRALQIPVLVVRAAYPPVPGQPFDPGASPTWPQAAAEFRHGREIHLADHQHLVPMQDPDLIARLIADECAAAGG